MTEGVPRTKEVETAYFTVEAAFVLPVVLGVIVLLIYLMFYQYDRCLLDQDTGIIILRASTAQLQDNKERLEEIKKLAARIYMKKYVAFYPEEITGRIHAGRLEVNRRAAIKVPFPSISRWTSSDSWSMEASFSSRDISPEIFIRVCRKAKK